MKNQNLDSMRFDRAALEAELKAAGAKFKGKACTCPFHDDTHPSAGVYQGDDKAWRFKCQVPSCGFQGDLFDVRAKATGRSLTDVLADAGAKNEPPPKAPAPRTYPTLADMEAAVSHRVATYSYTNPATKTVELVVMRVEPPGEHKRFIQAHQMPGGGFVMQAPPKPLPLYNRARIAAADDVVMVEGEKCVHALHTVGVIATTTPGGAGKAEYVDLSPLAGKRVTLWPDADEPDAKTGKRSGIEHMQDVARRLEQLTPPAMCYWIDCDTLGLPAKGDAADLIESTAGDTNAKAVVIRDVIAKASPLGASSGVLAMLQAEIDGKRTSVPFPWPTITRATQALLPGTVTLIAGDPGASKSFFLLQAATYWHDHRVKVALLELEENRDYHLRRVMAQQVGQSLLTDLNWVKDNPDQVLALHDQCREYLDSFGRCVHDAPDKQMKLSDLVDWVTAQAKAGCRVIAVDPITATEQGERQWAEDGRFMVDVKRVLDQYGASLVAVTHPKKGNKNHGPPGMDDLAGGAAFIRFSQTIIWLQSPDEPKEMVLQSSHEDGDVKSSFPMERIEVCNRVVRVAKARNARGSGWQIGYHFDGGSLTFSERGIVQKKQHNHTGSPSLKQDLA